MVMGSVLEWRSLTSLSITSETESTLSKFAEDMKLSGAVNTKKGRGAIEGDLEQLEESTRTS